MKSNLLIIISVIFLLCGCDTGNSDISETLHLPEVNAENCEKNNVAKLKSRDLQEKFSALCARNSNFKSSEPKEW